MTPEAAVVVRVRYHGLGRDEEQVELAAQATYEDLLRARDIHPETVLVFENDAVVPHESPVRAGAEVRVLRILSGG